LFTLVNLIVTLTHAGPGAVLVSELARIREIVWATIAGAALIILSPLIASLKGILKEKSESMSINNAVSAYERLLPHLDREDRKPMVVQYLSRFHPTAPSNLQTGKPENSSGDKKDG